VIHFPDGFSAGKTLIEAAWEDEGLGKNDSNGSDPLGMVIVRFASNAAARYG